MAVAGVSAKERLKQAIVWDNHACMPLRADDSFLPQLKRFRDAGVDIVSLNIGYADTKWTDALRVVSFMRRWIAQRPDEYRLIRTVEDVRQCKRDGVLGVVFDIEGMDPVEDDLSLVQTFYELGVRWMLVAYNRNNRAGGGCLDEDGGLTALGRAIIDEMERVGMVLCLSHTGARTAEQAMDYARKPVIFSHSNPSGAHAHPRNVSDALMRACAAKGGVIGINGIGPFLGADKGAKLVDRFVDHLRYAIDLVGPRHVGLGVDYLFDREEFDEWVRQNPAGFPADLIGYATVEPEMVGEIAERLSSLGLGDEEVAGVLGENWLRIASEVWR